MTLPTRMRQWVTKQDGIKNLDQETVAMPEPGESEVLVKISTVSLNYRDTEGIFTISVYSSDQANVF
jgi:NADPH:quinone reductase-like Zn-dependent oxidoreductase